MHTLTLETEPLAIDVTFSPDLFHVVLDNGRELAVPLAWFPHLTHGTPEQRLKWEFIGHGEGLHWPELDEDISVRGLLAGRLDPDHPRARVA